MGTNVCEEAKLKCFLLRLKKNNSETSRSGMELVNVGILSRKISEGADGEYETDRSVKNPRSYRGAKEKAQLRATVEPDTATLHQSVRWPQPDSEVART